MYTEHSAKPTWLMTTAEIYYWHDRVEEIIVAFRRLRADANTPPHVTVDGRLTVQTWLEADYLARHLEWIGRAGKVRLCGIQVKDPPPRSDAAVAEWRTLAWNVRRRTL